MDHQDFIHNKYFRWYVSLVSKPDVEGYTERHHKLPRCMGGKNDRANVVRLTARKHFLAHWLLTKCTTRASRKKMLHAFGLMARVSGSQQRNFSSWQFDRSKRSRQEANSGENHPWKGRNHRPETKVVQSRSAKLAWGSEEGAVRKAHLSVLSSVQMGTPEAKAATSNRHKGNKYGVGKTLSNNTKKLIGAAVAKANRTRVFSEQTLEKHRQNMKQMWVEKREEMVAAQKAWAKEHPEVFIEMAQQRARGKNGRFEPK